NLRINVLAAAVLSLTGVGLAQAADLKANAPLSGSIHDPEEEFDVIKNRTFASMCWQPPCCR
ncbi:hypothetical protein C7E17_25840, partial [Stenotrophomonas maltophilia]